MAILSVLATRADTVTVLVLGAVKVTVSVGTCRGKTLLSLKWSELVQYYLRHNLSGTAIGLPIRLGVVLGVTGAAYMAVPWSVSV